MEKSFVLLKLNNILHIFLLILLLVNFVFRAHTRTDYTRKNKEANLAIEINTPYPNKYTLQINT